MIEIINEVGDIMIENENYIKVDLLDSDQQLLLSARSCKIDDNRIILSGVNLPIINHETQIKAVLYLKDGIMMMHGKVTISTDMQTNIEILDYTEKEERRQNIKVKAEFKSRILKVYRRTRGHEFDEIGRRGIPLNEEIRARDISVGGICFYSNKRFFKNQSIFFEFDQCKKPFVIEAVVLRKEASERTAEYRYRYGCKLVNLSKVQQESICEYVFRIEIENYKKLK